MRLSGRGDNTVFQNPNNQRGVVPKGGSTFFLSKMLGSATVARILLAGRNIDASRARQLDIVDQAVPLEEFYKKSAETALFYAQIISGFAVGIKKRFGYNLKALSGLLEYENQ